MFVEGKDKILTPAFLQKLEKALTFLTKSIKQPRGSKELPSLKCYISSDSKIIGLLIYKKDKIYTWGEYKEDGLFHFDRSVPEKFLPNGKEKIDPFDL